MPQEISAPAQTGESAELVSLVLETYDQLTSVLHLDELMPRIAELVKRVIDFEIFAILLLNEKTQQLLIRFSVGHPKEVERSLRMGLNEGIVGRAAATRRPVLVHDVDQYPGYIKSVESVRSELAIPLIAKGRTIGVLDLEAGPTNFFTERDQRFLTLLAAPIAMSIENARLYRRSVRQARNLALLGEINREFSSILDSKPLLLKLGEVVRRVIEYDNFQILLLDESTQTLNTWIALKRNEEVPDKLLIPMGKGIVGTAGHLRQPILVPDVRRDSRYIQTDPETRTELTVPLIHGDRVLGVLDLESVRSGAFSLNDQELLTNLAPGVAIAIENSRLYERVTQHEARMKRDLARAHEIQRFILPTPFPSLPGLEVGVHFRPARELGGDLYDFILQDEKSISLALGDVSGKGAPAALYGAMATGVLRSLAARQPSPADMMIQLNQMLQQRQIEGHFLTLCYSIWEPERRRLQIANAGMPLPILIRAGAARALDVTGIPLGLLEVTRYEQTTVSLEPGDVLCYYSDGINEALNAEGEFFGGRRLEEVLLRKATKSVQEILAEVFGVLGSFAGSDTQRDDQTVMIVKVL